MLPVLLAVADYTCLCVQHKPLIEAITHSVDLVGARIIITNMVYLSDTLLGREC